MEYSSIFYISGITVSIISFVWLLYMVNKAKIQEGKWVWIVIGFFMPLVAALFFYFTQFKGKNTPLSDT